MSKAIAARLLAASISVITVFGSFRDLRAQGYESGEGWSVEWVLPGCLALAQGGRRDYRAGVCLGIVMAVIDMRSVAVSTLRRRTLPLSERQRMAHDAICEPQSATDLDAVRAVITYARRTGADGALRNPQSHMFTALTYTALRQAWPCEIPTE